MEVLSEHNCQGWLQGYVLTGRHGVFPCYEAFIPIVDGMVNQYGKFLKMSREEAPWREPVASLNYLLTSEGWRQDHNGYSHQMPGFINSMLNRRGSTRACTSHRTPTRCWPPWTTAWGRPAAST